MFPGMLFSIQTQTYQNCIDFNIDFQDQLTNRHSDYGQRLVTGDSIAIGFPATTGAKSLVPRIWWKDLMGSGIVLL